MGLATRLGKTGQPAGGLTQGEMTTCRRVNAGMGNWPAIVSKDVWRMAVRQEDVERVRERLAANGWPLDEAREELE